jgi:Ca-activated chloride channel family protein
MPREFTLKSGSSNIPAHQQRLCGIVLLLLLAGFSRFAVAQEPAAVPAPAQTQPIRVNVDRVNVGVVVTDAKGKFVEGLQRENFQVLDNGAAQPIAEFASIETPAQVLLVIEAGPAVYLLQDVHLFVADSLLNGLAPADNVAIARYTAAPAPILNFTTDKRAAQAALDQIDFSLGFGSLNLASSLNTILDWLAPVPGKKTIVLISSGVDTSPQAAMQSAFARLQTSEVQLLAISISGPLRTGKTVNKRQAQQTAQTFEQADAWLTTLSEATGGRAFFPENGKALQETYKQLAEIIRHEYSLAFSPPAADGATHSIDVKVDSAANKANGTAEKPSDYRVAHRKAYTATKPAP